MATICAKPCHSQRGRLAEAVPPRPKTPHICPLLGGSRAKLGELDALALSVPACLSSPLRRTRNVPPGRRAHPRAPPARPPASEVSETSCFSIVPRPRPPAVACCSPSRACCSPSRACCASVAQARGAERAGPPSPPPLHRLERPRRPDGEQGHGGPAGRGRPASDPRATGPRAPKVGPETGPTAEPCLEPRQRGGQKPPETVRAGREGRAWPDPSEPNRSV